MGRNSKPRIGIVGFGKMGKAILEQAMLQGFEVNAIIDPLSSDSRVTSKEISKAALENTDVCIEFTQAGQAIKNIQEISSLGKDCVIGTTGWLDGINEMKDAIGNAKTGLVYSANFSIGVNLFYRILESSARQFSAFQKEYDCYGLELHHKNKLDSPSGTAKEISRIVIENFKAKNKAQFDKVDARKISPEEFHLASVRAGAIVGTHTVGFDSEFDSVTLTHEAKSRNGFALGALKAAEFVFGKKGIFQFKECIDDLIKEKEAVF
ncbi:MAG: 4-hydroxy-tetrahydrodipicolinate reductase [Candidatus Diapherotrites archaeon]|nr:4-hydroxy-tetrahydrodipicolinate reductase [Candidatus Diapherotrites archaeon]